MRFELQYGLDMSNATRPNRLALRTLRLRLAAQQAELSTCTTAAMTKCVAESIADTERQIREAGGVL